MAVSQGFKTFTIASGQTTTPVVTAADIKIANLKGEVPVGVYFPAAFTGTKISFLGAADAGAGVAGAYDVVKNTDGSVLEITFAASAFVPIDPLALLGVRFLKIKSDATELAARNVILATRPY